MEKVAGPEPTRVKVKEQYEGRSDSDGEAYLFTIYEDGTAELRFKTLNYPGHTWSKPLAVRKVN